MTDVDRLLQEFIAEDRAGGAADPAAFLARADADAREELAALLDGYLSRAPRRAFDGAAFAASPSRGVVDALDRSVAGSAGTWPALLPRLRDRARLRRSELVARLASALGASDREAKVGSYYHAMEQGTLPAAGVSDRVLEALGRIVGESVASLREAGRAMTGPAPPAPPAPAFARLASAPAAAGAPRGARAPVQGRDRRALHGRRGRTSERRPVREVVSPPHGNEHPREGGCRRKASPGDAFRRHPHRRANSTRRS